MTIEEVYYASQIVAALGVIASLMFLAIQARQNSRTMRAQASWNAQAAFAEINDELASGSQISQISFKAFNDPGSLTQFE